MKNWTKKDLKKRVKFLSKLYREETNYEKLKVLNNDIRELICFIENYDTEYENSKYKTYKQTFKQINFLLQDFKKFSLDNLDFYNDINVNYNRKNDLSKNELLELTYDFYKSLSPFYFKYFMKSFRKRDNYLNFDKKGIDDGFCLFIKSTNEIFISSCRSHLASDYVTLVHEYGHATSFNINPDHLDYRKNLFNEIDAIFLEILAADYYFDMTGDNKEQMEIASYHLDFIDYANSFNSIMDFIKMTKNNKKEKQNASILLQSLDSQLNYSDEEHLISYLFAVELYNLYQNDKEKALDILKNVIMLKCDNPKQYYNEIKNIGLSPNKSMKT